MILIRDTIFEITCTVVDYFDSVVIARSVSEPSCDVISVSILECHWIQAIIASSLKYFCHHHQLWNAGCWLGSQNLFVVHSDLGHRPISSPPVVGVSGLTIETVTSSSGTTISSLGTPRKVCVPRPCDTVHQINRKLIIPQHTNR